MLVCGRQHGLLEEDFTDANIQAVPLRCAEAFGLAGLLLLKCLELAIEESLGTNVPQSGLQDLAIFEESIERIDMRLDRLGQRRVGCVICGWVLEQVLSSQSVVFDRPLGVGGCGRHVGNVQLSGSLMRYRKKRNCVERGSI